MSTLKAIEANLIKAFALDKLIDGEYAIRFNYDREIKTIAYAVNLTPYTIEDAVKRNADILLTHHDAWQFLYGMDKECAELLVKNRLNHAFFHSPLDDTSFGTSNSLAEALGLKVIKQTVPYNDIYLAGVVGEFSEPLPMEMFALRVEKVLDEKVRIFVNNVKPVKKVCITTGAGNMTEHIQCGVDENCDTYLTGEYCLYSQLFAGFKNINLVIGSHTRTEILGTEALAKIAASDFNIELWEIKELSY